MDVALDPFADLALRRETQNASHRAHRPTSPTRHFERERPNARHKRAFEGARLQLGERKPLPGLLTFEE